MRIKASKLIAKAKEFLDVCETPINKVIFNTAYYGEEVSGDKYPWKSTFMWYIFKICGASEMVYGGEKFAVNTRIAYKDFCEQGLAVNHDDRTPPEIGDLIFTKDHAHAGFVTELIGAASFIIIEGDSGVDGKVREVAINAANALKYIRPDYIPEFMDITESDEEIIHFYPKKKKVDTSIIPIPELKRGDQGKEVNKLRELLNKFGYTDGNDEPLASTGKLGLKVLEALYKFQEDNGIEVIDTYNQEAYDAFVKLLQK